MFIVSILKHFSLEMIELFLLLKSFKYANK